MRATSFVVDASVTVKWLLPESLGAEATCLLDSAGSGGAVLHSPELWLAEVANVLWKRTRVSGPTHLDGGRAATFVSSLATFGVVVHAHGDLMEGAFDLARRALITPYDALYVALAVREGCPLVTADDRLVARLAAADLDEYALPLRDLPRFLGEVGAADETG